ncbi:MAG: rubrerythrin family protein [Nitrososphaerales archaeon]
MSSTEEDLKKAFAGESQASRRYKVFADKAEREGYPHVARLFRAASEAETIHATNDLLIMRGVKSTADNLKTAIEGETYEYTEMYPGFIKDAKKDGRRDAEKIFQEAKETEEYHASYYKEALELIKQKKDIPPKEYYICTVCGYTAENEAPDECPICGATKKSFRRAD